MILAIAVLLVLGGIIFGKGCLDLGLQSTLLVNFSIINSQAMLLVAKGVDRFVGGKSDGCASNRIRLAEN
jgi:hypothetical protein